MYVHGYHALILCTMTVNRLLHMFIAANTRFPATGKFAAYFEQLRGSRVFPDPVTYVLRTSSCSNLALLQLR